MWVLLDVSDKGSSRYFIERKKCGIYCGVENWGRGRLGMVLFLVGKGWSGFKIEIILEMLIFLVYVLSFLFFVVVYVNNNINKNNN